MAIDSATQLYSTCHIIVFFFFIYIPTYYFILGPFIRRVRFHSGKSFAELARFAWIANHKFNIKKKQKKHNNTAKRCRWAFFE